MGDVSEHRRETLQEGIYRLYQNGKLCDVIFTMKGKYEFRCHKLVLAAQSAEFERLLCGFVPECIFIEKECITKTGFEILLHFCYTKEIGTEAKIPIIEAFTAADYYKVTELKEECVKKMQHWTITVDEVWELLNAGLTVPVLRERCLAFIENNAPETLSSPSFQNISIDCMNVVLDSRIFRNMPKIQYLCKIMEWSENYRITKPSKYGSVREVLEKNELLGKMEIETLALQELNEFIKLYRDLLTFEEVMQFMRCIVDKDASYLPSWCISTM